MLFINKKAKTEIKAKVDLLQFSEYTIQQIEQALRRCGSFENALVHLAKQAEGQPVNKSSVHAISAQFQSRPIPEDTIEIGTDGTLLHL